MGVKLKQKDGAWWLFINHNGLRKAKKIGSDKRRALDVKKKVEAKLALGEFSLDEKKVPTFGEYASRWIATVVPATCKASSLKDYQSILARHVLPVFAKKPIDAINRLMVKEFLMEKGNEGFSASTLNHLKNCISGILNLAVDDEIISFNPAHRLGKVIKTKPRRFEGEPLNREELSLLLETFKVHYPKHYAMAMFLCRTGCRFGEALALQWGDIDFNSRFVTIQRGLSRGSVETPKSGKSRRVDMSRQLCEVLKDLLKHRKAQTLRNGWREVPQWVFISENGTVLHKDNWRRRVFERALAKAGLRKVRVHDFRHGFASQLIQNGESLAYVRDQLGHSSIQLTVDVYGHLEQGKNRNAVDKLDDYDATKRNPDATNEKKEANQNG